MTAIAFTTGPRSVETPTIVVMTLILAPTVPSLPIIVPTSRSASICAKIAQVVITSKRSRVYITWCYFVVEVLSHSQRLQVFIRHSCHGYCHYDNQCKWNNTIHVTFGRASLRRNRSQTVSRWLFFEGLNWSQPMLIKENYSSLLYEAGNSFECLFIDFFCWCVLILSCKNNGITTRAVKK